MDVKLFSRILASLLFVIVMVGCKKDSAESDNEPLDQVIEDQYGRQLILHGLNTSSSAKYGNYLPWIEEADVEREAKEYGFNYVRLLTSWVAIEPQQGVYDENYINELAKRVEWYTSRGMYVMIDMHQDVYGACVGGNGHPDWSCIKEGAQPIDLTGLPWWLKNIDPTVIASWKNFWEYKDYKFLQDHYVNAWLKLVERFKDNPCVIGYDLMNEPWPGDLVKAFVTGEFERNELPALYNRLIPAIRKLDPNKYIFFEPLPAPVTFGAPTNLPKMVDDIADPKLVMAPHMYPYSLHEGGPYTAKDEKNLKDWERERKKDVRFQGNIPLVCGEFGVSPSSEGFDRFLTEALGMLDRNQWHWTYWSNDKGGWSPTNGDGTETPICNHLVRAFPKATAGRIKSFSYEPVSKVFEMTYVNNPSITQPTEIFIPERHYPNGYNLEILSKNEYTHEYIDDTQVLLLRASGDGEVKVTITPK